MKQFLLSLFFVLNIIILGFSQSNEYAGSNGTIITIENIGNTKWISRRHIQRIQIGDLRYRNNLDVKIYKEPDLGVNNIIRQLNFGEYIDTKQVVEAIIENIYYIWLNIETDNNINGWVFLGRYEYKNAQWMDPYFDNRWEITNYMKINDKIWTIRKMVGQNNSVWEVLNIRDKPGLINTRIVGKIVPPLNQFGGREILHFEVMEATEELDTIDGKTDRWLKINYNGVEGWIFGGYTGVERGGAKYYIPESIIFTRLGLFKL
jgi:hypothetical protein